MAEQTPPQGMSAEELAKLFHETYESRSVEFGYKTREATAKPWHEIPADHPNKKLMLAVCEYITGILYVKGQQFEAGRAAGWRERGEHDVMAVVEWPLSAANMDQAHRWFKLIRPAQTAFSHAIASVCRVALPKAIKAVALPAAQPAEEGNRA